MRYLKVLGQVPTSLRLADMELWRRSLPDISIALRRGTNRGTPTINFEQSEYWRGLH